MHILVCGGAGYIGSHMVALLRSEGLAVTVLDNLSTGHREAVEGVALVEGDIRDAAALDRVFAAGPVDAVMHFCALSLVGESMREPLAYYDNNVAGTLSLLAAMRRHGVSRLVFSSSAAVYGQPRATPIDETHPCEPINPYGASKRMVERILADAADAHGLRSVSLRYFNAAGAAADGRLGESHDPETHLIPNVLRAALGQGGPLRIFGEDYDTPDGTCVRDYVHVEDLAQAHRLALDLMDEAAGAQVYNLGSGTGFSVRQVLLAAERVVGRSIPHETGPRRPGDPPVLVASRARAEARLGWQVRWNRLDDIIASAWRWHQRPRF